MGKDHPARFSPLRRLLSFPLLRPGRRTEGLPPSEGELLFELAGHNPENRLFGRFGPEDVRDRMRAAGILEGLARKGYPDPLLALECGNPQDQRVALYAGEASRDRVLMEVRLEIGAFRPGMPIGPFSAGSVFRMLLIHWLVLSDPERSFSFDRPRLPGQQRPGLGLLSPCLSLLRDLGKELSLDGVLDVPDHFHTALFYSGRFRFIDPVAEGRFRALARDLEGVPLALASEAVALECLVDAATGKPLPWVPAEQVMALRDPLRRYLRSDRYRRARDQAAEGLAAGVDWDLYRRKIGARGDF